MQIFILKFIFLIIILQNINCQTYTRQVEAECEENGMLISNICFNCMENCTECTVPGQCDKCDDVWFQYNNSQEICEITDEYIQQQDFIDYQINPLISEVDGCLSGCRSSGTYVCTECSDGYSLISGVCQECGVDNCLLCTDDINSCTQCQPGYVSISSTECSACNSVNCYTCIDTTSTGCSVCNIGYIGNGAGGCSQCIYGCAVCADVSTCSVCYDGFYKDDASICVECGDNIKACSDDTTIIQCDDDHALISGACVNVENIYGIDQGNSCKAFVSAIECQECFEGYILYDDICQKTDCDQGEYQDQNLVCQSCGDNTSECTFNTTTLEIQITACQDQYYLDNNLCLPCINNPNFGDGKQRVTKCLSSQVQECEEGFQLSYDQYNCVPCPDNCKSCLVDSNNSITKCNNCNDGYLLTDTKECTVCEESNHCKTCESNLVTCITCPDGYYLTDFGNCSNSIPNCYTIEIYGCKACRNGFSLSEDKKSCIDCKTTNECPSTCIADNDDQDDQNNNGDDNQNTYQNLLQFQIYSLVCLVFMQNIFINL